VQKVLWACTEMGVPFERVDAGLQFGVNNTAEYKAMNPNGLVPTISDDGFILWESHAIVRYLARKHGLGIILPRDERDAADADRWMEWYSTTLWNNMRPVFWNLVRIPAEKRNMAQVEDNRLQLVNHFALLNAHLETRDYVAAGTFTMGDIPLALTAFRWFNLPIERPDYPALKRWFDRLCERPAFQQHGMAPLT
jgi:glutathione S-transferase